MRTQTISGMRVFSLMVVLWLGVMLVVATPAWADDDDDDDDDSPTTTTTIAPITTIPPTTTSTFAPTTTTDPPPPTTAPPPRPTTTTVVTTTTTTPIPRDGQWEEQRLESWSETTTTTSNPEPPVGSESKESLVLSIALASSGNGEGGPNDSDDGGFHISPREGLGVVFRTAVEAIEGQLLQAMMLGTLIAAFTMAGVGKHRMELPMGPSSSQTHATKR